MSSRSALRTPPRRRGRAWRGCGSAATARAKAQQLRREYEAIPFRDGEAIEDFALRLTSLVSQLAQVGVDIGKEQAVANYLRVVPPQFA